MRVPNSYGSLESVVSTYFPSLRYNIASDYVVSCSKLEKSVADFLQTKLYFKEINVYGGNLYLSNDNITKSYGSSPSIFLNPGRSRTEFVGDSVDIEDFVRDAFRLTVGEDFPDDISLRLCDNVDLKRIHESVGGVWSDGINGFAVNRKKAGQGCEVFVLKDELAKVMVTVGHEIGHCLTVPLCNVHDEEAKAFAFELAWVEVLHKHDIAGLASCLVPALPAMNGLHNVAFDFVRHFVRNGLRALDLCFRLVSGELSVKGWSC